VIAFSGMRMQAGGQAPLFDFGRGATNWQG
jgi:ribonuclease Z